MAQKGIHKLGAGYERAFLSDEERNAGGRQSLLEDEKRSVSVFAVTFDLERLIRSTSPDEQRFLLVYEIKRPSWGNPGGSVEGVETIEDTMFREFFEETGYTLPHIDEGERIVAPTLEYFRTQKFPPPSKHEKVTFLAAIYPNSPQQKFLGVSEIDKVKWFTAEEVRGLPHLPDERYKPVHPGVEYVKETHRRNIEAALADPARLEAFAERMRQFAAAARKQL